MQVTAEVLKVSIQIIVKVFVCLRHKVNSDCLMSYVTFVTSFSVCCTRVVEPDFHCQCLQGPGQVVAVQLDDQGVLL